MYFCLFPEKSDAVEATRQFLTDIAPYGKLQRPISDNGTEYTSKEFKSLMINNDIKQEFSVPYSPHQNCTAGRSRHILFDMARCMLLQAKLPKVMWNYAVGASSYNRNGSTMN